LAITAKMALILWFLPKAKSAQMLTPNQGGGHKGHSAIDQALQQVAEMEIT